MSKRNEVVDHETAEVTKTASVPSTIPNGFALSTESAFKLVKTLAVPVLPFPDGATIQCRIVAAAKEGRAIEGGMIKQAARLLEIEARSGEKRMLIANKVLERELESAYPEGGYVGRVFLINRQAPKAGKRYPTYLIEEIEWV